MARPREHDLDDLLDHARTIWAREGRTALTIRSLSVAAGVSNGAIYHAFGSRGRLLAAAWIREADSFLASSGRHASASVSKMALRRTRWSRPRWLRRRTPR